MKKHLSQNPTLGILEEFTDVIQRGIQVYGSDAQLNMLNEEIGELLQAVNKTRRERSDKSIHNLHEEIADVEVMLYQLKIIAEINPFLVADIMHEKLKRHENRLAKYPVVDMKTITRKLSADGGE